MGFFSTMGSALGDPLKGITLQFVSVIPAIISAAVVVVFGYLLGLLLGHLIKQALHKMKFDDKFKKLHLAKPLEKIKISALVGWVVKWYTFVIFVAAGATYINLDPVSQIVSMFAAWFPKLLIAMGIGLAGAMAAEYVHKLVLHVSVSGVKLLANIAKYFILMVVIVLAMDQIIDVSILKNVLLILVGGLALGIAISLGVGVGLAMKDEAAGWIASLKNK